VYVSKLTFAFAQVTSFLSCSHRSFVLESQT